MSVEHTPGPWTRQKSNHWSAQPDDEWPENGGPAWITIGRDGDPVPVALVIDMYRDENYERLEANACFIAAAPDTAAERDRLLLESEQRLKRGAELSLMVVDLQAERDRLEKENCEFHNNWVNACDALNVVEAERDRLRAEVERLKGKLEHRKAFAQLDEVQIENLRRRIDEMETPATPPDFEKTLNAAGNAALESLRAEKTELVAALEIIAGRKQCIDNLMSNGDIARAALAKATATEGVT